ncbi:hypothetical protein C5E05_18540 [Pseudoclavibacter sp. AY1H1]|nr:hypothetical protein C5E05_18540 [Pseudoclavibacter sp. AY1H1]
MNRAVLVGQVRLSGKGNSAAAPARGNSQEANSMLPARALSANAAAASAAGQAFSKRARTASTTTATPNAVTPMARPMRTAARSAGLMDRKVSPVMSRCMRPTVAGPERLTRASNAQTSATL